MRGFASKGFARLAHNAHTMGRARRCLANGRPTVRYRVHARRAHDIDMIMCTKCSRHRGTLTRQSHALYTRSATACKLPYASAHGGIRDPSPRTSHVGARHIGQAEQAPRLLDCQWTHLLSSARTHLRAAAAAEERSAHTQAAARAPARTGDCAHLSPGADAYARLLQTPVLRAESESESAAAGTVNSSKSAKSDSEHLLFYRLP